jgi:acyl-CoA dehydrogenase
LLRLILQPFGARDTGPTDLNVHQCAQMILEPSAARERLTAGLYHIDDDRGLARLEKAFTLVAAADGIDRRMRAARLKDWREAVKRGVITASDGERIRLAEEAVAKVVEVDDFAPEQLSRVRLQPISREELFAEEVRAAS